MLTIYFSGTGNSKYVAQMFSNKMGCECYSIEENIDFKKLIQEHDTLTVVYPIYGGCVPFIFRDFINKHKNLFSNKKLIIICTQMLFSGDGAKAFIRLMPNNISNVIYAEHINMPNNISNAFFIIGDKERVRKVEAANKKINAICNNIKIKKVVLRGWGFGSKLLGYTQNLSWPMVEKKAKSSFVANNNCTLCGLCVKSCPPKNLEIVTDKIIQKNRCTVCYRCVNICPSKACTVMLKSVPKTQYKGPII